MRARRRSSSTDAKRLPAGELRQLLECPPVAIGVGEVDEAAPGLLVHLAGVDPALEQVGAGTTIITLSSDPGVILVRPLPKAIEQPEPGGVIWTKRMSSLTVWSWSALNPTDR